jgi:hypothetical protein
MTKLKNNLYPFCFVILGTFCFCDYNSKTNIRYISNKKLIIYSYLFW